MNFIYVTGIVYPKNSVSGARKKIISEIKCLRRLGVEVNHVHPKYIVNTKISFIIYRLFEPFYLLRLRKHYSKKTVIYIRRATGYLNCFPSLLLTYRHPKNYLVVLEPQDIGRRTQIYWPHNLSRTLVSLYDYISMVLFEKKLKNNVDAIVSVTNEITNYNSDLTKNKLSYMTLGNGLTVQSYNVRKPKRFHKNDVIDVLIVALVEHWHGIDRFIRGLHEYESTPDKRNIVLHIVGDGAELPHLKELTAELNLQDRVIFHGFKSGKELDEMFDMCHIALDALAGFRKGLTELSSLKSREYCARGIPFLMASKDADFPEGFNWIQMVPADEQPIDMNTVVNFTNRMMADPEHPQKMRRYAEEHLDWMAKMKVLKEFLESL